MLSATSIFLLLALVTTCSGGRNADYISNRISRKVTWAQVLKSDRDVEQSFPEHNWQTPLSPRYFESSYIDDIDDRRNFQVDGDHESKLVYKPLQSSGFSQNSEPSVEEHLDLPPGGPQKQQTVLLPDVTEYSGLWTAIQSITDEDPTGHHASTVHEKSRRNRNAYYSLPWESNSEQPEVSRESNWDSKTLTLPSTLLTVPENIYQTHNVVVPVSESTHDNTSHYQRILEATPREYKGLPDISSDLTVPETSYKPKRLQKRTLDLLYHKLVEPRLYKNIEPRPSLIEDLITAFDKHIMSDIEAWKKATTQDEEESAYGAPSTHGTPATYEDPSTYEAPLQSPTDTLDSLPTLSEISSVINVTESANDDTYLITDEDGKTHIVSINDIVSSLVHLNDDEVSSLLLEKEAELGNKAERRFDTSSGPVTLTDYDRSTRHVNLPSSNDANTIPLFGDGKQKNLNKLRIEDVVKSMNGMKIFDNKIIADKPLYIIPVRSLYDSKLKDKDPVPSEDNRKFDSATIANPQVENAVNLLNFIRNAQTVSKGISSGPASQVVIPFLDKNEQYLRAVNYSDVINTAQLPTVNYLNPVHFTKAPEQSLSDKQVQDSQLSSLPFLAAQVTKNVGDRIMSMFSGISKQVFDDRSKDQKPSSSQVRKHPDIAEVYVPSNGHSFKKIYVPLPKPIHYEREAKNSYISPLLQSKAQTTTNPQSVSSKNSQSGSVLIKSLGIETNSQKDPRRNGKSSSPLYTKSTAELILDSAGVPMMVQQKLLSQMKPQEDIASRVDTFMGQNKNGNIDRFFSSGKKKEEDEGVSFKYALPPSVYVDHPAPPHPDYYQEYPSYEQPAPVRIEASDGQPLLDISVLADMVQVSKLGDENNSFVLPKIGDASRFVNIRRPVYY